MSIDTKFIFLAIVPYVVTMSIPKPLNPPFTLSITIADQTVRMPSEIKVATRLTNISNHLVTFFDTNRDCDYPVEVRDDTGNPAPETNYKRQLKCNGRPSGGRNILVTLKPWEFRDDEIVLTRLYELTRPGNYFVQVARKIPKELGGGTVKSNTIAITVSE